MWEVLEEEEGGGLVVVVVELVVVAVEEADVDGRADRHTMAVDSENARLDMIGTGAGDGVCDCVAAVIVDVAVGATAALGSDCRSKGVAGR